MGDKTHFAKSADLYTKIKDGSRHHGNYDFYKALLIICSRLDHAEVIGNNYSAFLWKNKEKVSWEPPPPQALNLMRPNKHKKRKYMRGRVW